MSAAPVSKFGFFEVRTREVERLADYYEQALGLAVTARSDIGGLPHDRPGPSLRRRRRGRTRRARAPGFRAGVRTRRRGQRAGDRRYQTRDG